MNCKKIVLLSLIMSALCFVFVSCGSTRYTANGNDSKQIYLRNNIHFQERKGNNHGSYANWTEPAYGHAVIPVNTVVEIKDGETYIYIINKGTGKKVEIEYSEVNMDMSVEQYIRLITSTEPTSLTAYSEIDRKGIADGKAYIGMTKDGVRVALGYPAKHRTLSLDYNTWVYWRDRFRTRAIDFDKTGKVVGIR